MKVNIENKMEIFFYLFRYSIINATILSCLKETILYMVVNNVVFDYGLVKSCFSSFTLKNVTVTTNWRSSFTAALSIMFID